MTPVQQTYDYILENWQAQTLDGKRAMSNQLDRLTVLEKNALIAAMLENGIRRLDDAIRLDIDQEISYGRD
jgi:hypothetical protein